MVLLVLNMKPYVEIIGNLQKLMVLVAEGIVGTQGECTYLGPRAPSIYSYCILGVQSL